MLIEDIRHIEFEISSRCNAGCPMCPRTKYKERGIPYALNDLTLGDIKDALPDNLRPTQFKLSGNLGDPAVNPDCYRIIEYLALNWKNNVKINMHTNGGTRNEKFWTDLGKLSYKGKNAGGKENKFRLCVRWAIDGLEDTNHLYRVGVDWNKIMKNLRAYLDAGGYAEWHFITFPWNEHQVEQVKEFAHSLGMPFVERRSSRNSIHKENYKKKESQHAEVEKFIQTVDVTNKAEWGDIMSQKEKDDLYTACENVSCQHLNFPGIFISSSNTVWPCCMLWDKSVESKRFIYKHLPKDFNWNNLYFHSLQDILNTKWYKKINTYWNPDKKSFIPTCIRKCSNQGKFGTSFTKFEQLS